MRIKSIIALIAVTLVLLSGVHFVGAQSSGSSCSSGSNELKGWAWSSTIGWVSFSSANPGALGGSYKVCIESNGNFAGYAWSPNIGWVSFEPADLTGCPSGVSRAKVDLSSDASRGTVSGWARAIRGIGRTDGWDGCIELAGPNHPSAPGANKGVYMNPTTGAFTGFAWGSEVVGWLDFSTDGKGGNDDDDTEVVCTNNCGGGGSVAPTCKLTASPLTVPSTGGTVTIKWESANNPTSCTGTGFSTNGATSGIVTENNVSSARNYSMYCVSNSHPNPNKDACAAASVTVTPVSSGVSLFIGRTPQTATAKSLQLSKGQRFALAWNRDSLGSEYVCTPSVFKGTTPDVTNWSKWRDIDLVKLKTSDSLSSISTNASMATANYRFKLSCTDGTTVKSDSVNLILGNSTQTEF